MPYYYEVVVHRHGQDRVLQRVPTQRAANHAMAELIQDDVFSRSTIRWERRPGLHPWTAAMVSILLALLTPLAPLAWLRVALLVVLLALSAGFLTSGRRWVAGGVDDR